MVQLWSLAFRIPLRMLTPDSSINGSLKTPRLISPETLPLTHFPGSNPSLTLTRDQSAQVQPLDIKVEVSGPVKFLKSSLKFIKEQLRFFILQLQTRSEERRVGKECRS